MTNFVRADGIAGERRLRFGTKEIVMPKQKDLKRLIRSRMEKTGEAYTAARLQVVKKKARAPQFADVAGMSDASVKKQTGRNWAEWVRVLDAENAAEKPHREIAAFVSSLGTPDWWTQMVTVGYERIRGLRQRGQRRDGGFEASKSRTFKVRVEKLFAAFFKEKTRRQWLDADVVVASATAPKRMRISWTDGTPVLIGFTAKGDAKSSVAIQHQKLADKRAAEAMKKEWSAHFDRLAEFLGG
jgi:uncharacterized protein YndB with AHSA1/START domain